MLEVSGVYRSPAFGFEGDDFLNVVVSFRSALEAAAIETRLNAIERSDEFAPSRGRFAPRALDCDLLMVGSRIDPAHRLPRDDVLRYPFVLGPLAELTPQLRHPLDGRTLAAHWSARRATAQLQRIGDFADLRLPADAAPAIDGEDLPGHVGRVSGEK